MKILSLIYGVASYVVFFATFLYMIGFLGNFGVPRGIDGPPAESLGVSLAIDAGLILLFGLQHSVMARPGFKRWLTRLVPAHLERSTYVLASSVALLILFWQWRPLGGVVWTVEHFTGQVILFSLYGCGWLIILGVSFLINHFDLFGLRQVWLHFRGRAYTPIAFTTPGPYRVIRHPLYIGWLLTFWMTPVMTVTHLVLACGLTIYILMAIPFEERDLVEAHGRDYLKYRDSTPALVPFSKAGPRVDDKPQSQSA